MQHSTANAGSLAEGWWQHRGGLMPSRLNADAQPDQAATAAYGRACFGRHPQRSDDHWHGLNGGGGRLPVALRQDDDPQRLDSSPRAGRYRYR
jgi:hypothetical protein